ncbi:MAG: tetratricopeptide repeat protein [Candidatus Auribacterota bacterium]|nr:tetratricopeptide repeat protein [Candidatus Auribacterota bacterium]
MSPCNFGNLILTTALLFTSLSSSFSEETIESLILEGDKNFNESNCEAALRNYRDATELEPDNLPARLGLAYSLYRLERYKETARELQEAIQISPRNISLYYWLIDIISAMDKGTGAAEKFRNNLRPRLIKLWLEEDYRQAIADFRKITDKYPDNAWAGYWLGRTYLNLRLIEKAHGFYEESSRLAPGWASPLIALNTRSSFSTPERAINNLKGFLRKHPSAPEIYYALGSIYEWLELPEKARTVYETLLASSRKNLSLRARTRLQLFRILLKEGDYKEALDQLNRNINLAPQTLTTSFIPDISRLIKTSDTPPDHYRKQFLREPDNINLALFLARLTNEKRDYKKSIQFYQKAMELCLHPTKRSYINSRMIDSSVRAGLIEELKTEYLSRIKSKPKNGESYLFLSQLYINRAQEKEAIRILQEGLDQDPRADRLRSRLASCCRHQGLYPRAITEYRKLITTTPLQPKNYGKIADCLFKSGEISRGRKVLDQLCQIMPGETFSWSTAGRIYQNNGLYPEAIKSYSAALSIQPHNYYFSLKLAQAYKKLRQYSQAGRIYQAALKNCGWPRQRKSLINQLVRLYNNIGRLPELAREYEERLEIGE